MLTHELTLWCHETPCLNNQSAKDLQVAATWGAFVLQDSAIFNMCVGFNSQLLRRAAKGRAERQIAANFAEGQRRTLTPMITELR
jgi:hypothetical protein